MRNLESLHSILRQHADVISQALVISPPVDTEAEAVRGVLAWLMKHPDVLNSIVAALDGWRLENLQRQSTALVALRLQQIIEKELPAAGIDPADIRDAVYEVALESVRGGARRGSAE